MQVVTPRPSSASRSIARQRRHGVVCVFALASCIWNWHLHDAVFAVASSAVKARPRPAQTRVEIGQQIVGKVQEVAERSATVDLGEWGHGFLHISHIQEQQPKAVMDVIVEGDEVTVRVMKVKPKRIIVTMLDLPMFRKRALSDFKKGDRLEGTVVSEDDHGIVVDVGAIIDGVVKKNRVVNGVVKTGRNLASANPEDYFEVGQKLKVMVAEVTKTDLVLRFYKESGRVCRTCGETVSTGNMFGKDGHHWQCTKTLHLGNCFGPSIPPFFERNGNQSHCIVGPVPREVQTKVRQLVDKGRPFWWKSSRPKQKGRLHGVGCAVSTGETFAGTRELKALANDVLWSMLDTPMVELFNASSQTGKWSGFPDHAPPHLPPADVGVAVLDDAGSPVNAYVGLSYMHVRGREGNPVRLNHGPPPPVAKLLSVPPCTETCKRCRTRGCLECDDCCVHVDDDSSASILLGIQEAFPAVHERAFFVMGDKAFPLTNGRAFVFDGKTVPHGVWCMKGNYTGMAFVKK